MENTRTNSFNRIDKVLLAAIIFLICLGIVFYVNIFTESIPSLVVGSCICFTLAVAFCAVAFFYNERLKPPPRSTEQNIIFILTFIFSALFGFISGITLLVFFPENAGGIAVIGILLSAVIFFMVFEAMISVHNAYSDWTFLSLLTSLTYALCIIIAVIGVYATDDNNCYHFEVTANDLYSSEVNQLIEDYNEVESTLNTIEGIVFNSDGGLTLTSTFTASAETFDLIEEFFTLQERLIVAELLPAKNSE